jgi:hypothetical protein
MAMLNSEPGRNRPKIGAQAVAYVHQEKCLAQLAIGPTQILSKSQDRKSGRISRNKIAKKPEALGQTLHISPSLHGGALA